MQIKAQVQQKINQLGSNTILIHSDIMQGFKLPFVNRNAFMHHHITELCSLSPNINIWMPTFNYDFCKNGVFDVCSSPSQVGVLSEYFRQNVAQWRTSIPVFSFAGMGEYPVLGTSSIIDPFNNYSAFHALYENNAILMHYGSSFHSSTIVHYAERMSGCLAYRYDKLFYGKTILQTKIVIDTKFLFHVRPLGKHLDYAWERIEQELLDQQILFIYQAGHCKILLCDVRNLVDFLIIRMKQDPLGLLDNESKIWVDAYLQKLGRPFIITDFEIPKES